MFSMQVYKKVAIGSISLSLVGLLTYLLIVVFFTKSDESAIPNSKSGDPESYGDVMKSYMNLSVDPCDDFYEYACGNYQNSEPLCGIIFGDLANLKKRKNQISESKMAERFYKSCLGADLHPFPATDPHYLALIRSIGGFPAVDGAWNASNFSWFNMSAHMTNYQTNGLISERIYESYPFEPYLGVPELGFDTIVEKDILFANSSQKYKFDKRIMRGYLSFFKLPEDIHCAKCPKKTSHF